jgi:hypothetical protein
MFAIKRHFNQNTKIENASHSLVFTCIESIFYKIEHIKFFWKVKKLFYKIIFSILKVQKLVST